MNIQLAFPTVGQILLVLAGCGLGYLLRHLDWLGLHVPTFSLTTDPVASGGATPAQLAAGVKLVPLADGSVQVHQPRPTPPPQVTTIPPVPAA